jgi:SNF2 family DNA or RNA helicase
MKMDSNHVYISAPYQVRNIVREELNGVWSTKHQAWRFPKSLHAIDEVISKLPEVQNSAAFEEIYTKLSNGRTKLRELKAVPPKQDSLDKLRPYQRQDVQYLTSIPNAGVFNQPRTGKTPTMIETIKQRRTIKNIVITPASLQYNWKAEIERWHSDATVYMYAGTPKQREQSLSDFKEHKKNEPAYLIVSKDTAKRYVDDLTFDHDVCVIDEAHYLRNSDTKQSQAAYTIGYRASHRYALTGTPTVKHPADVFGILKFLYPHKFTSYWQFVERYFDVVDNGWGKELGKPKPHRVTELQDIIDAMSTQRLRKDVMQWLPDKQYHKHEVVMSTKQSKLYQSMLDDFFAQQGDHVIDTQNVLAQLMRLRQICLDPTLLGFDAPSAKTEALIEAIEDNTYDEPVIIMSMFTSYLNMLKPELEKLGKRVKMITGEMSNADKEANARSFQRGEVDVLLCNIISAGTGFTLDRGEVIIFTDKAWNPSDNEQAEDRVTPTKEENIHKHFIVSMVCTGTVDERIEHLLSNKQSLTAIVNECKTYNDLRRWFM